MPKAVARRSSGEPVKLPPIRPEESITPNMPVWPKNTTSDRKKPKAGLALAKRREAKGDVTLQRARALQHDLAIDTVTTPPATPRDADARMLPILVTPLAGPTAARGATPQRPVGSPPSPPSPPASSRRGPRTRKPSSKKALAPLCAASPKGARELRPTSAAASPAVSTSSRGSGPRAKPLAPAPPLPAPSLAERGGGRAGGSAGSRTPRTPTAKRGARDGGSSSARARGDSPRDSAAKAVAPAAALASEAGWAPATPRGATPQRPPPPTDVTTVPTLRPTPYQAWVLPAAPSGATVREATGEQLPTSELGSLFSKGMSSLIKSTLAPAEVDEQWAAVRALVLAC